MTLHSRPSRRTQEQTEAFVSQAAAEETVQLHCLIPLETHRRLRILAAQDRTTVTSLVLRALDDFLEDN